MSVVSLLYWVYLTNAVLLIVHEIDSAYWKEWELFRLLEGISFFLLVNLPLVALILHGLTEISSGSTLGTILSTLLALGGLFAFTVHTYLIRKGNDQFKTTTSQAILVATLTTSLVQLFLTLKSQ